MKAHQWPNKLGWNVGQAEVRDLVTKLRVFTPVRGQTDSHKVADVALGTDPVLAVQLCRKKGLLVEAGLRNQPVPTIEVPK